MAQQDIVELRELPLEQLISAPLIAVIKAQAQAAVTTAKFVEEIGFVRKEDTTNDATNSFLDNTDDLAKNDYDVRVAKLHIDVTQTTGTGSTGVATNVEIPFITFFTVPNFEISNFDWQFNVKLKSMQSFSAKFATSNTTTVNSSSDFGLKLGDFLKIGHTMKVESTIKTDFESRFKSGREQEYNLNISIKGNTAPLPKGIEVLLSIAENAAKQASAPPTP